MCVLLQPIEAKNLHVASLPGIFWQIEGIDVNVVVVGVLVEVEVELDEESTVVVEMTCFVCSTKPSGWIWAKFKCGKIPSRST